MSKVRSRSVAYPSLTLEKAIELSGKLSRELGKGPYSRDMVARGIGHDRLSGPAARKVAALVHYGLLDRTGNAYNQSELARHILNPINESEKRLAIIQAIKTPKLYMNFIERFQNQALPAMLDNIFIREKITPSVAKEASETFRESLIYSGLLKNDIVINPDEVTELDSDIQGPVESEKLGNFATENETPSESVKEIVSMERYHEFVFKGGVRLVIPKSESVDEAILDGALKDLRSEIKVFSEKYCSESSE